MFNSQKNSASFLGMQSPDARWSLPLRKEKRGLCSASVKLLGAVCDEPIPYHFAVATFCRGRIGGRGSFDGFGEVKFLKTFVLTGL
jgi:hypothetical protein